MQAPLTEAQPCHSSLLVFPRQAGQNRLQTCCLWMDSFVIIANVARPCQALSRLFISDKLGGVDLHAGAHGGADHAGADILALGRRGLGLHNGVHQGIEVLLKLLYAEGDLADGEMCIRDRKKPSSAPLALGRRNTWRRGRATTASSPCLLYTSPRQYVCWPP